jgi:hypothetical protein
MRMQHFKDYASLSFWVLKNYLLLHRATCNLIHVCFKLVRQETYYCVSHVYLSLECSGTSLMPLLE